MNKRTILLAAFTVLVLAQWAVPSSMILRREASLRQGKEFKLRVRPLDPYDAFRGRFVRLDFDAVAVAPSCCAAGGARARRGGRGRSGGHRTADLLVQ